MGTVIGALLPLIVTLGLGVFAAWRHEFSAEQAAVLNRMVLLYAVPLLFFANTVTIERDRLTADLGLAVAIAVGMLSAYLVTFLIARFGLRRSCGVSALRPSRSPVLWCCLPVRAKERASGRHRIGGDASRSAPCHPADARASIT
jgi:hypothetical protein